MKEIGSLGESRDAMVATIQMVIRNERWALRVDAMYLTGRIGINGLHPCTMDEVKSARQTPLISLARARMNFEAHYRNSLFIHSSPSDTTCEALHQLIHPGAPHAPSLLLSPCDRRLAPGAAAAAISHHRILLRSLPHDSLEIPAHRPISSTP